MTPREHESSTMKVQQCMILRGHYKQNVREHHDKRVSVPFDQVSKHHNHKCVQPRVISATREKEGTKSNKIGKIELGWEKMPSQNKEY